MPTAIRVAAIFVIAAIGTRGVVNVKGSHSAAPWPSPIGISRFGVNSEDEATFKGAWLHPDASPFVWGKVESKKGTYDWRTTDASVRAWQKKQLAVVATLLSTSSWDAKSCDARTLVYTPCNWVSYLSWVKAAVERYDGDGVSDMPGLAYAIRHWEVENEPDVKREPSSAYNTFYNRTYQAVKEADATASVLPGGQSSMDHDAKAFWKSVFDNDNTFVDIGNIHATNGSDNFYASEYRFFLNSLGYAQVPFWVTEADTDALFISTVKAFANGAERVFVSNASKHADVFDTLTKTVNTFTDVKRLGSSSVLFTTSDRFVYALWNGAKLPSSVTGIDKAVTHAGDSLEVDPKTFRADTPTFVFVKK